mgnify:CR=1 FL=1
MDQNSLLFFQIYPEFYPKIESMGTTLPITFMKPIKKPIYRPFVYMDGKTLPDPRCLNFFISCSTKGMKIAYLSWKNFWKMNFSERDFWVEILHKNYYGGFQWLYTLWGLLEVSYSICGGTGGTWATQFLKKSSILSQLYAIVHWHDSHDSQDQHLYFVTKIKSIN